MLKIGETFTNSEKFIESFSILQVGGVGGGGGGGGWGGVRLN